MVGSQEWVGSVLTLRMDTSADGKDGNYFHVSIQFIFIPQIRKLFIIYFYAPLWSRPYIISSPTVCHRSTPCFEVLTAEIALWRWCFEGNTLFVMPNTYSFRVDNHFTSPELYLLDADHANCKSVAQFHFFLEASR